MLKKTVGAAAVSMADRQAGCCCSNKKQKHLKLLQTETEKSAKQQIHKPNICMSTVKYQHKK
jgi:hypothetical protein